MQKKIPSRCSTRKIDQQMSRGAFRAFSLESLILQFIQDFLATFGGLSGVWANSRQRKNFGTIRSSRALHSAGRKIKAVQGRLQSSFSSTQQHTLPKHKHLNNVLHRLLLRWLRRRPQGDQGPGELRRRRLCIRVSRGLSAPHAGRNVTFGFSSPDVIYFFFFPRCFSAAPSCASSRASD